MSTKRALDLALAKADLERFKRMHDQLAETISLATDKRNELGDQIADQQDLIMKLLEE